MAGAMNVEPENPQANFALSRDARHVRAMGIHEHAALIEAIMRNFPEIYEKPFDSNHASQTNTEHNTGPAMQSPSPA